MFIKCSVESVIYREEYYNDPVNLKLCKTFRKCKYKSYPDNIGKYSIEFIGVGVIWVYDSEFQRDSDFNRLLKKCTSL